jgi:hypothetical protein
MENKGWSDVIGASGAPYINHLAAACGLATRFYAEAHPSLPNYIAMTSGSTHGITDDAGPASHQLPGPSIFSQAGSWRALEESMRTPCERSQGGGYAVRHNPAAYYAGLRAGCPRRDRPLPQGVPPLARFTFVTPNLCHDMHDCSVAAGDRWLSAWLARLLESVAYRAGGTAVVVTWDEDDGAQSQHIPTLVAAPSVRPGTRSGRRFDHYAMLRTTEDMLGIGGHLGHAAGAASMRAAFGM